MEQESMLMHRWLHIPQIVCATDLIVKNRAKTQDATRAEAIPQHLIRMAQLHCPSDM
jgi:hypothetical protein